MSKKNARLNAKMGMGYAGGALQFVDDEHACYVHGNALRVFKVGALPGSRDAASRGRVERPHLVISRHSKRHKSGLGISGRVCSLPMYRSEEKPAETSAEYAVSGTMAIPAPRVVPL